MKYLGTPPASGRIGKFTGSAISDLGIGKTAGLNASIGSYVFRPYDSGDLNEFATFAKRKLFFAANHEVAIGQNLGDGDRDGSGQLCSLIGAALAFAFERRFAAEIELGQETTGGGRLG